MSRTKRCALLTALVLVIPLHALFAKTQTQVVVQLKNGAQVQGVLQTVGDSALIIYRWEPGTETVIHVGLHEIQKVVFKNSPELLVVRKNGQQMTGKLDTVEDSLLVLMQTAAYHEFRTTVALQQIQRAKIKAKSKILPGMGKGLLVGGGSGILIGLASGDDEPGFLSFSAEAKAALLGTLLGGAGLIVGGIAGATTSTREKEIEFSAERPFSLLQAFAEQPGRKR